MSSEFDPTIQRRRVSTGPFLTVLAAIALIGSWNAVTPIDFYQFWFVSRTNLHGVDRPYSPQAQAALSQVAEQRLADQALTNGESAPLEYRTLVTTRQLFEPLADGRMIQSTGTPLLYAMASLVATDSFEVSGRIAHAVILFSYIASLLILADLLKLKHAGIMVSWLAIWTVFIPARFDVFYANVAGIQLAMLLASVAFVVRRQFWLAGLIAAVAALFKPTGAYPVIAISLYVVAMGNWRSTFRFGIGGLTGGAVAVGLTTAVFSTPAIWTDWFTLMLPQVAETSYLLENGNCGLNALLLEWTGERETRLLTCLIFVPALVLAAARGWSDRRRTDSPNAASVSPIGPVWVITTASAAMLLSAPLAWQHYYVLLIPGLIAIAARRGKKWKFIVLAALVCQSQLGYFGIGGEAAMAIITASMCCASAALVFLSAMFIMAQNISLDGVLRRSATPHQTVTRQKTDRSLQGCTG